MIKARLTNEGGGEIDLADWYWPTEDIEGKLNEYILRIAAEILVHALNDDSCWADFTAAWGDKTRDGKEDSPKDPLAIHISIPLSNDEGAIFEISLSEILRDDIKCCHVDGSFRVGLARIASALHKLADEAQTAVDSVPEDERYR